MLQNLKASFNGMKLVLRRASSNQFDTQCFTETKLEADVQVLVSDIRKVQDDLLDVGDILLDIPLLLEAVKLDQSSILTIQRFEVGTEGFLEALPGQTTHWVTSFVVTPPHSSITFESQDHLADSSMVIEFRATDGIQDVFHFCEPGDWIPVAIKSRQS